MQKQSVAHFLTHMSLATDRVGSAASFDMIDDDGKGLSVNGDLHNEEAVDDEQTFKSVCDAVEMLDMSVTGKTDLQFLRTEAPDLPPLIKMLLLQHNTSTLKDTKQLIEDLLHEDEEDEEDVKTILSPVFEAAVEALCESARKLSADK